MALFESLALAGFPLISGMIFEGAGDNEREGFEKIALFFAYISLLAAIIGTMFFFIDKKGSEILDYANPDDYKPEKSSSSGSDGNKIVFDL